MRGSLRAILCVSVCLCWISAPISAHDTPVQLSPPESDGEAWNVIEQCKENINHLLAANLMRDVGGQLANISIALRYLNAKAAGDKAGDIQARSETLIDGEAELLHDSRDENHALDKTKPAWTQWCDALGRLEPLYPPDTVHAQVYICPMHPQDRHLNPNDRCSICGMSLVRRHLPESAVYQTPGQQTLKLTASCPPLVAGQSVTVVDEAE